MKIETNIPLSEFTTMRLGGPAQFFAAAKTVADISSLVDFARSKSLPIFILGGGSNTIARDEGFAGLVIQNLIPGFEVIAENNTSTTFKVGGGENWDEVVNRTVEMNLSGIEALSTIPGTAGAAPVQNIGAYGQEVASVITQLEAYDLKNKRVVILQNSDCKFSYRHSIFRGEAVGRYCIISVTIKLDKAKLQPPFYRAIEQYMADNRITDHSPKSIREIVTNIRKNKLPDPRITPNTGSFFKNTIVDETTFLDIKSKYPGMPSYEMPGGKHKIPTGWLIEQAGLKGEVLHGMKIHDKNALVLINQSALSYRDLAEARQEIISKVREIFGITIEQEPLEI